MYRDLIQIRDRGPPRCLCGAGLVECREVILSLRDVQSYLSPPSAVNLN